MSYFHLTLFKFKTIRNRTAAAVAAALMLGGEDPQKFLGRSRLARFDYDGLVNPGSRQIYLTFPSDSTFREEDVSNYFKFANFSHLPTNRSIFLFDIVSSKSKIDDVFCLFLKHLWTSSGC